MEDVDLNDEISQKTVVYEEPQQEENDSESEVDIEPLVEEQPLEDENEMDVQLPETKIVQTIKKPD